MLRDRAYASRGGFYTFIVTVQNENILCYYSYSNPTLSRELTNVHSSSSSSYKLSSNQHVHNALKLNTQNSTVGVGVQLPICN